MISVVKNQCKKISFLLLLIVPVVVFADISATENLLKAEKKQDWQMALKLADEIEKDEKSKSNNTLRLHISKLRNTILDLELAAEYHKHGKIDKAAKRLSDSLDNLEKNYQSIDIELLNVVSQQLNIQNNELYKETKKSLDREFGRVLKLEDNGKRKEAIEKLKILLKDPGRIDYETLVLYEDKLFELEHSINGHTSEEYFRDLLKTIGDDFKSAVKPVIYTVIIIIFYILFRIKFYPFKGRFLEIALEDQSDATKNKAEANKTLSQEFDQSLKRIVNEINEGGELNELIELGGAELSSMSTGEDSQSKITEYLNSDPIQIGVLKFTPKSLFELFASTIRTRGESVIAGSLFKDETGEYVLRITKRNLRKNSKKVELVIDGRAKERKEAITLAAMQLVVIESDSTVTKDWRSLQELINAQKIQENLVEFSLSAKQQRKSTVGVSQTTEGSEDKDAITILDNLKNAKRLLQKALAIDPSNWIARYRLANVLHKIGDNRTAYWQYNYVIDMLCNENIKDNTNSNIASYVKKEPTFPLQLLYNKIICMNKMGAIYLNSNIRNRRDEGFNNVTNCLCDLKLLATKICEMCSDDQARESIERMVKSINKIIVDYGVNKYGEEIIRPNAYTIDQLEKLEANDYIANFSSEKQKSGSNIILASNNQKKTGASEEKKKVVLNDLIYQIYAGVISIVSNLYEYHIEYPKENTNDKANNLFEEVNNLEKWLYRQRMKLNDKNRNAYSFSHGIAHNSAGRANYIKLKQLVMDNPDLSTDKNSKIKYYFNQSENYLRWAIGYHLPASFAEPYINLASLYLKSEHYSKLQGLLPAEWRTKTEEYLRQAIRLSPKNHKAHYLLGLLYKGRIFEDALLDPDKSTTDNSYTSLALQEFENAGEDSFAYYRAGQIYADYHDYQKALIKLKQCIQIYHIYDVPHQFYLKIASKYLNQEYAALVAEYSDEKAEKLEVMLDEALKLSNDLKRSCIKGKSLNPYDNCSTKLNIKEIYKYTDDLKNLNKSIDALNVQNQPPAP